MRVIFFRHATRSALGPGNGGLNDIGRQQALHLIEQLQPSGPLPVPTELIASPKRRAQETLAPLSKHTGLRMTVSNDVDERRDDEPGSAFLVRVRAWTKETTARLAPDDVIFVCSHLDWLEEAMRTLASDLTELELERGFLPCEWRAFEIRDGVWYSKT